MRRVHFGLFMVATLENDKLSTKHRRSPAAMNGNDSIRQLRVIGTAVAALTETEIP
jgi:hypothetical protein